MRPRLPARSGAALGAFALAAAALLVPLNLVHPEPDVIRTPVTMAIKDAGILVIAETISINSGFIALTAPDVAHRTVALNIKDVPAIDALRQAASAVGLRVVKVPYMAPRPGYMLLPPGHPDPVQVYRTESPETCSMAIKDASLLVVLETIGINMGWNVVLDPALGNMTVSVNFDNIPATQAMNYVADLCDIELQEQDSPGAKPTWIARRRR